MTPHRPAAGRTRGDLLAVVYRPGVGVGLASPAGPIDITNLVSTLDNAHDDLPDNPPDNPPDNLADESAERAALEQLQVLDQQDAPRWVLWSQDTALHLVRAGVRLSRSWDLSAAHRLLHGGWEAAPARVWAAAHGLDIADARQRAPIDLFHQEGPDDEPPSPVDAAGHLDPAWIEELWCASHANLAMWAQLALDVAARQLETIGAPQVADAEAATSADAIRRRHLATARSESTAELLCAELSVDGLPFDRQRAEAGIATYIGPRPRTEAEALAVRAERDALVTHHVPGGRSIDLRSPGQVKSLLRRVGIEVPDTRAWRLESLREVHPVVDALLTWRKAERVATTYGYAWLDSLVPQEDGPTRLRGTWSGSDGAAGRMTATAGLHNLPADLRTAVIADDGWRLVRSDLGQIEPRVLAAVSGDVALIAATHQADMYATVASELGVTRDIAKVAVLGAMYGQTTGRGAQALAGLQRAYPTAIAYLEAAAELAQVGTDLRTFGGRLVRMSSANANDHDDRELRSQAAARGRFGRNAMVQGAAAEFFKLWAVTVRARATAAGSSAHIVLCLHDELLVHVPEDHAAATAELVDDCLQEAAHRWLSLVAAPAPTRFVADTTVIGCWAEAKG